MLECRLAGCVYIGGRERSMRWGVLLAAIITAAVIVSTHANPVILDNRWTPSYAKGDGAPPPSYPQGRPGSRAWSQASFDDFTGEIVLFGGSSSTYMSDTWTYHPSDNTWHKRQPHPDLDGPCRRDMHNMVYDPIGGLHWLFNGISYDNLQPGCAGYTVRPGSWTYNRASNVWTKRNVPGEHERHGAGMVYVPDIDSFIEFGGTKTNAVNETWRFNLLTKAWTKLAPTGSLPSPRLNLETSLVYDSANKKVVLFSGKYAPADTWLFDPFAVTWMQIVPPVSPPKRNLHSMAYDPLNRVVVLFGGKDGATYFGDTWVLNVATRTWQQLTNVGSPGLTAHHTMIYDPNRQSLVLTKGAEVWVLRYRP